MATIWRKNHKCEQPHLLGFVATATHDLDPTDDNRFGVQRLRCWTADFITWRAGNVCGEKHPQGTSADQFWAELSSSCKSKQVLWLFGFDLLRSLWLLEFPERVESGDIQITRRKRHDDASIDGSSLINREWRGLCSIDRGSVIIHAIRDGKRFNIVDVGNYFRGSPQSVAKSFGLDWSEQPDKWGDDISHMLHCRLLTHAAFTAMTSLMREWTASDMGNWQPTIPSLGYSAYRHKFMPSGIVCHNDPQVSSMEYDAYLDGRTQAYFLGDIRDPNAGGSHFGSECMQSERPWIDGPVHHLDCNALYPSVMAECQFPYSAVLDREGRPKIHQHETPDTLHWAMDNYLAIASVKLRTNNDLYPIRRDDETMYPVGTFNATLCTSELRLAIVRGHVERVNWAIYYRGVKLFTEWVNYWWQRRKWHHDNGNHAAAAACKVAVNSLSGKLAQRERFWTNAPHVLPPEPWHSWIEHDYASNVTTRCRSIGWSGQTLNDCGFSKHSLVAISAHINSYARVRMQGLLNLCPHNSCYYQGNDSLIVSDAGLEALTSSGEIDGEAIGRLRLDGTYGTAHFYGARDYMEGELRRKAGLPLDAVPIGERRWRADMAECAAQLLSRTPDGTVRTVRQIISGSTSSDSAGVRQDGWYRPPQIES